MRSSDMSFRIGREDDGCDDSLRTKGPIHREYWAALCVRGRWNKVTHVMSHLKGSLRIAEVSTASASESALDREFASPVYPGDPVRACISAVADDDKDDEFPLEGGRSRRSPVFDSPYSPRSDLAMVRIDRLSTERRSSTNEGKVWEGDPFRVEI
jgi:hypothetical protein